MNTSKKIPAVLWIAIIGMCVFACLHLIVSFSKPVQIIAFIVNSILLIGIYMGKKWAYVVTIIAALFAPLVLLSQDSELSLVILTLNLIVLIPLLLSTRYFFPKSAEKSASA
ncbi:hypothetical protein JXJ21_04045 [candidate division KSB1 bacterium]|nr:hypothetical protein [candidate division KSB1 bacterium]